ncbi:recombinase family protein [Aneurinibacillus thermoaerophilus]|uniref:recombinase family protein n=1 Tax=Aneurinibacillus thermoaerophilus TaxID=143495 RepID=UPI002E1E2902|nr:recombinase family protein [Aneurinibacillus thermoaerophilus]MED0760448.1 recombinase family protein [Aneurinibacillus thermoaerophilus]
MIPVAIYARVSTDQQGDSIEHQISLMKDYMSRNFTSDYYTNESFIYVDEGYSGYYTTILERPAMKQLLEDAKSGKFKVVLFKEITRMGRDEEENLKIVRILEASGVRIKSNDGYDSERPESKLLFKISNFMAEVESERISSRVSAGFREKARSGKWPASKIPFGYVRNADTHRLEIDDVQAEVVRMIFNLYVNDRIGTLTIANRLNEMGYKTANNNRFQQATIRKILENPVYTGDVVYGTKRAKLERVYDSNQNLVKKNRKYVETGNPVIAKDAHPAIIDRTTFLKAQEIMKERQARVGQTSNRAKYPLSGILYCAKCGAGMVSIRSTKPYNEKYNYRYYKCGRNHKYGNTVCVHDPVPAQNLERTIFELLMNELKKSTKQSFRSRNKTKSNALEVKLQALQEQRKKLQKKQVNIAASSDLFDAEAFREVLSGLKSQMKTVDQQIETARKQMEENEKAENRVYTLNEVLDNRHNIDLNDIQALRALFHRLIERIDIYDKTRIMNVKFKFDLYN